MTNQSRNRFKRPFVNLCVAQGISQFGDALLEITLPVWVGLVTKSPAQVAGVAATELLPAILIGPIAGVMAERFSSKNIMVLTNIFRAMTILLLLGFHGARTAYLAYIVSFLLSLGARVFVPAQSVLLRKTIRREDIQKAQGLLHVASRIALALGPALGGTLLLMMGPTPAVILDSSTFVVSALILFTIHQERASFAQSVDPNTSPNVNTIKQDLVHGLRFLLGCRPRVVVAIVTAASTFVGFTWFAVDVFYVKDYLGTSPSSVGYLWTVSGIGDLLAGLIIVPLAGRLNSVYWVIGGLFIRMIALISYSVIGHFGSAMPICLFAGFGDGMKSVALSTMAMQYSSLTVMGRVSSALDIVGQFSGIGATVFISTIGSSFTSRQDLLACGLLLAMTTMMVLLWMLRTRAHENFPL